MVATKALYRKIAKEAGILAPEIEYHRQHKFYSIGVEMSLADKGHTGFSVRDIGIYYSVEEAEQKIHNDIMAFLGKYPHAKDKFSDAIANKKRSPEKEAKSIAASFIDAKHGEGGLFAMLAPEGFNMEEIKAIHAELDKIVQKLRDEAKS